MASQQTGRRNKNQSSKAGSQPGVRKLASSEKKSQHRDSAPSYGHIFDERTKRDISAVALIVLSIALFSRASFLLRHWRIRASLFAYWFGSYVANSF